jgi:transposase
VTTVKEIVDTMEARFGVAGRIWVMDRGMTSAANIAWLQKTGRLYLIGTPKSDLKKFAAQITDARDWQAVRDGVEAKLCAGPDGKETFILVRSEERREKEKAMHQRFADRIEKGLRRLEHRMAHSRKPLDRGRIERQIGRLLGSNSRAAGRFSATLVNDPGTAAKLRLDWHTRPEWDDWSRHIEGCYVLRSNVNDWTPEALWQTYVQLSEAEDAFRVHKSDLSIRPVWHHTQDRSQAHILVCFLAYAMWKTLEQWQKRAGLGNSPRTILYELGRIQSTDVVLPLARDPRHEVRIRCVVRPDRAQAALLDRLGLRLPDRLRLPPTTCQM